MPTSPAEPPAPSLSGEWRSHVAAQASVLMDAVAHDRAERAGTHSAFGCPVCSGGREHTTAMCVRCYRPRAFGEHCIAHNPARTGKRVLP